MNKVWVDVTIINLSLTKCLKFYVAKVLIGAGWGGVLGQTRSLSILHCYPI